MKIQRSVNTAYPHIGIFVLIVLVLLLGVDSLHADPITAEDAQLVAAGWLRMHQRPFGTQTRLQISHVRSVTGDDRRPLYHIVCLDPGGYIIVPGDDDLEPVICFADRGRFDPSADGPLRTLITSDIPQRLRAVRALDSRPSDEPEDRALRRRIAAARQRWSDLCLSQATASLTGVSTISDVRVPPILRSTWGQSTIGDYVDGTSLYNYYTPPYAPGTGQNHPCGCVATAMSQIMRHFEYPAPGYDFSLMPLEPDDTITVAERQAIGTLCYDTAMSVDTTFGPASTGGSSGIVNTIAHAFKTSFGYGNAIFSRSPSGSTFDNMVNANLDASLPVIVSLEGPSGGHSVVCDGYGFSGPTQYHHLNMGWSGRSDVWYALPVVDSLVTFNTVKACIYNIFEIGTGEIVSGRALDRTGKPIFDAEVTMKISGLPLRSCTTDDKGIYAFINVPSSIAYELNVNKPTYSFNKLLASTLQSGEFVSGNSWGFEFQSSTYGPPRAHDTSASALVGQNTEIPLIALDDDHPNPPARLAYTITTHPAHGSLIDPFTGPITSLPHKLFNYGAAVRYKPCSYYEGLDSFEFIADDGGTGVGGGISDPATVTCEVTNGEITTYETQSATDARWPLRVGYEDSRTQIIYHSDDFGDAKTITSLALDILRVPGKTAENFTIRMKHTNMWAYSEWNGFVNYGYTTVFRGDVTIDATGWWVFEFQTPFNYDGAGNVLVDFSHNSDTYAVPSGECIVTTTREFQVLHAYSENAHGDPLNWQSLTTPSNAFFSDAVPHLQLGSGIHTDPILADFSRNCRVDAPDLAALAAAWMSQPADPHWDPNCDISPLTDSIINEEDFGAFADKWQEQKD